MLYIVEPVIIFVGLIPDKGSRNLTYLSLSPRRVVSTIRYGVPRLPQSLSLGKLRRGSDAIVPLLSLWLLCQSLNSRPCDNDCRSKCYDHCERCQRPKF